MEKYKHRVSFRLEKRKDKNGNFPEEMQINADITFGGKRIWYYSGYRIAPGKWDEKTQRVKRNNFNSDDVSPDFVTFATFGDALFDFQSDSENIG